MKTSYARFKHWQRLRRDLDAFDHPPKLFCQRWHCWRLCLFYDHTLRLWLCARHSGD